MACETGYLIPELHEPACRLARQRWARGECGTANRRSLHRRLRTSATGRSNRIRGRTDDTCVSTAETPWCMAPTCAAVDDTCASTAERRWCMAPTCAAVDDTC